MHIMLVLFILCYVYYVIEQRHKWNNCSYSIPDIELCFLVVRILTFSPDVDVPSEVSRGFQLIFKLKRNF